MNRKNVKKVLIVSQHFPPEIGGGSTHVFDICKYLHSLNCKIFVLTGHPCYPYGKFNRNSKLFKSERRHNLNIFRIWNFQPTSSDPDTANRLLEYLSFPIHAIFWLLILNKKIDFDIVLTSQPPETVCVTGFFAKILLKKRWVMDVRDLWHEAAVEEGYIKKTGFISKLAYFLKDKIFKKADYLACTSEVIIKIIADKYKIAESKFFLNQNGINPEDFKENDVSKKKNIIYLGSMGHQYDLNPVIDAMDYIDNDVNLLIRGDGENKPVIKKKIKEGDKNNRVFFVPTLSKKNVNGLLSESMIGIIPLRDGADYDFVLPIKVLEYFAAGLPVVGSGGKEVEKLLDDGRGIFISNNKKDFAKAINLLLNNSEKREEMGSKARNFVEENYNKPVIIQRLYDKIFGIK